MIEHSVFQTLAYFDIFEHPLTREELYRSLAKQYRLTLIPFFLDGVAGSSSLNQADGIHPTGEGYRLIVEKVFATLGPLLERKK